MLFIYLVYMMVYMVRWKKEERKRGPKYPEGEGKRRILLIVLNHSEGIVESDLIDEIKEKLQISNPRGIKGHLGDLGPGRTVERKWRKGKQYLIKIPSKFESKKMKEKSLENLKPQGIEIDINNLPEENFWRPQPDENTFKKIADELLGKDEMGILFIKTKYLEEMFDEYVVPHLNLSRVSDENTIIFLNKGVKLSPTALRHILFEVPEVKIGATMMPFDRKYYMDQGGDNVSYLIASLYVSLLIDIVKYPKLGSGIEEFLKTKTAMQVLLDWYGPAFKEVDIEEVIHQAAEYEQDTPP